MRARLLGALALLMSLLAPVGFGAVLPLLQFTGPDSAMLFYSVPLNMTLLPGEGIADFQLSLSGEDGLFVILYNADRHVLGGRDRLFLRADDSGLYVTFTWEGGVYSYNLNLSGVTVVGDRISITGVEPCPEPMVEAFGALWTGLTISNTVQCTVEIDSRDPATPGVRGVATILSQDSLTDLVLEYGADSSGWRHIYLEAYTPELSDNITRGFTMLASIAMPELSPILEQALSNYTSIAGRVPLIVMHTSWRTLNITITLLGSPDQIGEKAADILVRSGLLPGSMIRINATTLQTMNCSLSNLTVPLASLNNLDKTIRNEERKQCGLPVEENTTSTNTGPVTAKPKTNPQTTSQPPTPEKQGPGILPVIALVIVMLGLLVAMKKFLRRR